MLFELTFCCVLSDLFIFNFIIIIILLINLCKQLSSKFELHCLRWFPFFILLSFRFSNLSVNFLTSLFSLPPSTFFSHPSPSVLPLTCVCSPCPFLLFPFSKQPVERYLSPGILITVWSVVIECFLAELSRVLRIGNVTGPHSASDPAVLVLGGTRTVWSPV